MKSIDFGQLGWNIQIENGMIKFQIVSKGVVLFEKPDITADEARAISDHFTHAAALALLQTEVLLHAAEEAEKGRDGG